MSECCNQFIMEESADEFEMTEALKGDPGPGVAPGGTTGQILAKASDEDYDTEWIDQPELDAGHVEYDPAETYDDGSVGKELSEINSALSSLQSVTEIIDTASGDIASFPDGSGLPMRSLLATIEPQQDLHGYDNPWPAGCGKNLINQDGTDTSNGYVHNAYINSSGNIASASGAWDVMEYAPVEPNTTYTISGTTGSTANGFVEYNSSKTMVANGTAVTIPFTFTTGASTRYVRFNRKYDTDTQVQLEEGSSATAYQPFANICPISGWTGLSGWVEDEYDPTEQPTFSVSWQTEAGTVYGGTVDVVTGVLTVEWAKKIFNGTESWWVNESRGSWLYCDNQITDSFIDNSISGFMISNLYKQTNYSAAVVIVNGEFVYGLTSTVKRFVVKDTRFTTAEEFKASLATQNLEGVYKLAEPQTYQLTGQQISTLLGNNTVFVDTGSVSVTYQANLKGYIDKVLAS